MRPGPLGVHLPAVNRLKQLRQLHREHWNILRRLPGDIVRSNLRPLVLGPPPLDGPSIEIDNPVVRHANPLILPRAS